MGPRNEARHDRRIRALAAVLLLALAGLTGVLGVLLQGAWNAKRLALQRNLQAAVTLAAGDLEAGEISRNATHLIRARAQGGPGRMHVVASVSDTLPDPFDAVPTEYADPATDLRRYSWQTRVADPDSSGVQTIENVTVVLEGRRTEFIESVVGRLLHAPVPPLQERLTPARIDSVLGARMIAAGITVAPRFAVIESAGGRTLMTGDEGPPLDGPRAVRARLFPLDLVPPRYDLLVDLPGAAVVVVGQVWPLWAAAAVFLLLTVLAFALSLRAMEHQRRAAAHLTAFINNMTHEFKTPLATVSLACEALARRTAGDDDSARYLAMIREEGARLGGQVEHVLQMAQLERGELRRGAGTTDMAQVLAQAAARFTLRTEAAGGTLRFDPPPGPAVVQGDEPHLAAVVDNLLDNAVKYADGPPQISLRGETDGRRLRIVVRDAGPGIPALDQARVFEPYFRGDTGDRHDVKGFGLGLAFVRLIVELHEGRVRLDSRPGAGTTVTVELPLTTDPQPLPDAGSGATA